MTIETIENETRERAKEEEKPREIHEEKLSILSLEETETYDIVHLKGEESNLLTIVALSTYAKCRYAVTRQLDTPTQRVRRFMGITSASGNPRESMSAIRWVISKGVKEPVTLIKTKNNDGVYIWFGQIKENLMGKTIIADVEKISLSEFEIRNKKQYVQDIVYNVIRGYELAIFDKRRLEALKPNLNLAIDYICDSFSPPIPRELEEGICLSLLAKNYARDLKEDPPSHNAIYIYNYEKSTGKTATAMINLLGFNNASDPMDGFFEVNRLTLPNMTGWFRGETFIPPKDKNCLISLYDEIWAVRGDLAKQIQDLAAKHGNDEVIPVDVGNPLYAKDKKLYKKSIQICTGNYLPYDPYVCKRYIPFKLRGARTVLDVAKYAAINYVADIVYPLLVELHNYIPKVKGFESVGVEQYLHDAGKHLHDKMNGRARIEVNKDIYIVGDVYNQAEVEKQVRIWASGYARLNLRDQMIKEDIILSTNLLDKWFVNNGWIK